MPAVIETVTLDMSHMPTPESTRTVVGPFENITRAQDWIDAREGEAAEEPEDTFYDWEIVDILPAT